MVGTRAESVKWSGANVSTLSGTGLERVLIFFLVQSHTIALFTVSFSHLHYNVIQRGCEAISG